MRRALSVTLDEDNVLWLKAQAAASLKGTVSEVIDRLVARARTEGQGEPGAIRSVMGTIDLPADDPNLEAADSYVRGLFERSVSRPLMVREGSPATSRRRRRRG